MTTAAALISLILTDAGVFGTGQTPKGEDVNRMLQRLNMLLAQWNRRRWLVYVLRDTAMACDGRLSYTVGPGGDFNIARPDRLEGAYMRQTASKIDCPLTIMESREEYSQIALKSLTASPSSGIFYSSDFPAGAVFPWPLPAAGWELHILTKAVLTAIGTPGDELLLPEEYEYAIYTTGVNIARAAYRFKPDPYFIGQAKAALKTIRGANFQIGRLSLPSPISRGSGYNVFSDRGR